VAKAKEKKTDVVGVAQPSLIAVIVPVLLLTLVAAGGGFVVASLSSAKPAIEISAHAESVAEDTPNPEETATVAKHEENGGIIKQLAPIITNLASPKDTWMRIEVSLVINPEAQAEQDMIAVQSSDQILTMLRTVSLPQIEGPSGFLHFKEDINDLLRENSANKIKQVLINSMVVE
jgi:flagellar protein FliL